MTLYLQRGLDLIKRLLPVTALMLSRVEQDPEDANRLTLDGLEVSTVSLAGIAVGLNSQSTYTTILLNDGTDLVEVQRWNKKINEGEMDSEDDIGIKYCLGAHCLILPGAN